MVPWFPGGHADPWNHVEAAMALALGDRMAEAERAYEWLVDLQRPDGSWHQYYLADGVEQDKLDANVIAYVAAGVWHHWLLTKDRGLPRDDVAGRRRAPSSFVLELQTERGEILWARHADGTPWSFALLTGSSSICHSLRCADRHRRTSSATSGPAGSDGGQPGWPTSSAPSPTPSPRSTAGRWTGTTRCSPAC